MSLVGRTRRRASGQRLDCDRRSLVERQGRSRPGRARCRIKDRREARIRDDGAHDRRPAFQKSRRGLGRSDVQILNADPAVESRWCKASCFSFWRSTPELVPRSVLRLGIARITWVSPMLLALVIDKQGEDKPSDSVLNQLFEERQKTRTTKPPEERPSSPEAAARKS